MERKERTEDSRWSEGEKRRKMKKKNNNNNNKKAAGQTRDSQTQRNESAREK